MTARFPQVSHVYTFPSAKPFVNLLACCLQARFGAGDDPLCMARSLVLLPTRRSCLALRDAFLRLGDGMPQLLPRMQPFADVDEDALLTESWFSGDALQEAVSLPPAMPRGLRHVLLTELVALRGHTQDMEQAALLARDLARLLDAMALAGIGFDALESLVEGELATHWQKTLDFLDMLRVEWPRRLAEKGMMDPVERRNALLLALAGQWERAAPPYPVIAAGSTGSQPATAALLRAVAALPEGMVILPGLDREMTADEWEILPESHPQWGLKQLLEGLQVKRAQVGLLDDARVPDSACPARRHVWSVAMQPAEMTAGWRTAGINIPQALHGMERMECGSVREEAAAIALRLRQALEVPGTRAAVVTNDRALARMVGVQMQRFGVALDDSAGTPAWQSPPGVLLKLVADLAQARAAPVALLALLKHPLCTLGMEPAACRHAARLLERWVLRGVRPRPGIGGLRQAVQALQKPEAVAHTAAMLALLDALEEAAGKFMHAFPNGRLPLDRLLRLHMEAAEQIAGNRLWEGEAGEALAEALHALSQHGAELRVVEARQYPGVLEALLQPVMVRPAYGTHPRLHILSPMEARLQHFDVAILAGLNEGSWPGAPEVSPWMSRPMQRKAGLPLPEEAVGKAAHDFAMLACAPCVVLSRSRKAGGVATMPSRWVERLDTLLSAVQGSAWQWEASPFTQWAKAGVAGIAPPLAKPAPRPPLAARPKKLSVTEIETWQRDPYAIYAKHVLGLKKLDPLDQEPDLSDFGQVVHKALECFAKQFPDALPEHVEDELKRAGEEAMRRLADHPAIAAFWLPRFNAMIPWLAGQERLRRGAIRQLVAEGAGTLALDGFTLTTRIDRLELHGDGTFSLLDYKTGSVPKAWEIEESLCPQLALGALVVQEGALVVQEGALEPQLTSPVRPRELAYWKLGGEKSEVLHATTPEESAERCAAARQRLLALIEAFGQPDMPYLACPDPRLAPGYNDYEHLERREEWEWLEETA